MRPTEVRVRPDQGSVAGADLGHAQGDGADVTDREPVLERRSEDEDEHRQQRSEGQQPSHPTAPDGVPLGGRGGRGSRARAVSNAVVRAMRSSGVGLHAGGASAPLGSCIRSEMHGGTGALHFP